jgi:multidrug efflux pump subunit AcrA (membrane-fusion protein)
MTMFTRFQSLAALPIAFSVFGCGPNAAPDANVPPAPATVSVVHPERKSIQRVVEQPGVIQAYEETHLFARVPGYVRLSHDARGQILMDIGRKIRGPIFDSSGRELEPGEILAELEVPELEEEAKLKQAMARQAEAEVDQARKALAAAEANIAQVDATVVEAKALLEHWQSQSARMAEAVKSKTVDAQVGAETLNQYKAAGARVLAAEAAVKKARADRDKAAADVRAAEARVDVTKADAARALAMLSYAKIRAPYDGVVTKRNVSTGDFAHPAGGKGTWLFAVARLDPVLAVVGVPEADAGLVRDKTKVKLAVRAADVVLLEGTVTRTSWSLDPGARTLRTEIDLPNRDGLLRPGMYVSAQIISPLPEAWVLPATAVVKQDDTPACFLIEGGKAVRTVVQVGRGDGRLIEVLKRQTPGAAFAWEDFTGRETVAARAGGLKDGQAVQEKADGK